MRILIEAFSEVQKLRTSLYTSREAAKQIGVFHFSGVLGSCQNSDYENGVVPAKFDTVKWKRQDLQFLFLHFSVCMLWYLKWQQF